MEQTYFEEENSKGFDIKRYISKLAKNYVWFIVAIAVFVSAAYLYFRYMPTIFQVSSYVLIKQPTDASNILGGSAFGSGKSDSRIEPDISNEIIKLHSTALIGDVVDSLRLHIELKKEEEGKNRLINLAELPFYMNVKRAAEDVESPVYKLSFENASYTVEADALKATGKYNQPLVINTDTLTIGMKDSALVPRAGQYEVKFAGRIKTIYKYISRIEAAPAPKSGPGLLQVSVKDEIPERARDFINVLVYTYDFSNLSYNNQALKKEMAFLNERLAAVSAELYAQAKLVRDFKAGNQVFDVSSSANQLLANLPEIDARKSENILKQDLLNLVENNIRSYNGREEIVPNSSGLQDPVLGDQINRYNQLVLQKRTVLDNGTEQDPRLPAIDGQLQQIRSNILKNVKNIRSEIKANINSLAAQERSITSRFTTMPEKEKEMIELNRVLGIKQSLYTFLLQKREDKNLELASAEIAESRIVDNNLTNVSQYPKPLMFYGIAFAAGLLLPALIILIRVLVNNKVETRQDVEAQTSLPIAGEIGNVTKATRELVITPDNTSPEAEQFRTLRTNISYLTRGLTQKVLLVTSSKSEEGKSFVSLNLANSIAISNKKVALLEFDLRNPGLTDKLGMHQSLGLSNYLSGEARIEEIIKPVANSENLYFASCGDPLPSNPGELILSDKMPALFDYLKQNFDVIVIDTPPVGPVSDALTLGKWADISFFVIRHNHTLRSTIKLINKLDEQKKLPRLTLIINGIINSKEFNYGNDFAYGYGYQPNEKKKRKALANS